MIDFVQLDFTLDNAEFHKLISPLIKECEGKDLGRQTKLWYDPTKESSCAEGYPTYTFPDKEKKLAFIEFISEIVGISVIRQ